jgi:N-hydroxyarylamine O-acetyltransferase
MDIKKYLERINYLDAINPTLEVLSKLQSTHLLNVPFENLDIHNNKKIDLTNSFDKIVNRKRGGFCYELNGLFYELLDEIGFTVKMVSARVYDGKEDYSPEFDHMTLIVKLKNDNYLVDVGFGEFSLYPIKIELNTETNDPRGIFRIEAFNENYKVVKKINSDGKFKPEYIFSEKKRQIEEFYDRCNYHQTSADSHFMQKRVCSLPTKSERITLTEDILKTTKDGEVIEKKLKSEQDVQQELWNYFGINYDHASR